MWQIRGGAVVDGGLGWCHGSDGSFQPQTLNLSLRSSGFVVEIVENRWWVSLEAWVFLAVWFRWWVWWLLLALISLMVCVCVAQLMV